MKIGIICGCILGIILLLIGFIGLIISHLKKKTVKWALWVAVAGISALITAGANAIRFLI